MQENTHITCYSLNIIDGILYAHISDLADSDNLLNLLSSKKKIIGVYGERRFEYILCEVNFDHIGESEIQLKIFKEIDMKETMTITTQIPEGFEIDREKSTFENIVLKKIETKLPNSWKELNIINGYWVDKDSYGLYDGNIPTEINNRNVFATKEQVHASIALAQLSQLREVYRNGWKPDWYNPKSRKYVIDQEFDIDFNIYYKRFLSFQSKEIAELFLANFRDLIEKATPLLFD